MTKLVRQAVYSGEIRVPSSKSDTQRALLLAALAKGKSTLKNIGHSADERAMLNAIQQLGAIVHCVNENTLEIDGIKATPQSDRVSMEESGLGFRLMASVLALFNKEIILEAAGSLEKRPMHFLEEVLPLLGAEIRSEKGFPPLSVRGPLHGGAVTADGSLSSQFLSGLLIALPLAKGNSILTVRDLKSIPYIDMTVSTLEKFGISIINENYKIFRIKGNQLLHPCHYTIEGDWSAASCWLAASALGCDIRLSNLNTESLQADKLILDIFRRANCEIILKSGKISVHGSRRQAFEADLTHAPDLFPALAAFAALTPGKSILKGTNRLIHKESNRARAILEEFTKLGCTIRLENDNMLIEGTDRIQSDEVNAHGDHRIAMSLAVLGMFSQKGIRITGAESVSKSYPSFWEDLSSLEG